VYVEPAPEPVPPPESLYQALGDPGVFDMLEQLPRDTVLPEPDGWLPVE
jgi:hypothetical protein